jgi:hypothetical protein
MKGSEISSSDHITRYCKPKSISVFTKKPTALSFYLREEKDEENLSVNWLEFFQGVSRSDAIEKIRTVFRNKMKSIPSEAQLAVLNVGKMCDCVKMKSPDHRVLKVLHEPAETNGIIDESHCNIYNMKKDYRLIAQLMFESIEETYPARSSL